MPAAERIDSIYNMEAIGAEHTQLQKILQTDANSIMSLYNNLETFQGKSNVATVAKNWQTVSTSIEDAGAASNDLIAIQTKLNEQIAKTADLEKQLADAVSKGTVVRKKSSDLTDQEIRQKYDDTQASKTRTKEIIAQTDAYKALELQRDQSAAKAKTLQAQALETGNPATKIDADKASAQANSLNDALKRIDTTVGESRRRVGDYNGAISILEEELAAVNQQLAAMAEAEKRVNTAGSGVQNLNPVGFNVNKNKGGADAGDNQPQNKAVGFDPARYKQLTDQANALNIVIGQQDKGFTSVTQQTKIAARELLTLKAAGLEGSQGFKALQKSTADAQREQRNFNQSQKLLSDNVPILKSITIAAKGLAAAYAIGQGASALFADGNEKVEKELNKLVAIMSILQGLQEVHELLEKSNAIATVFKTAATKAGVIITGIDTEVTIENAAAKVEQANATLAAAASEEEQTLAAEGLAAAETELAVATEASTGAVEGLIAVIGATGIGLILIAVAAAVVALVVKMKEWTAETELSEKQQQELNKALQDQIASLQAINDLQDKSNAKSVEALEQQLALEEKSGKNQYAIFAIKEKIAAKNAEIADSKYTQVVAQAEDKYVKDGLIGVDALHRAQNDYFEDLTDKTYKVSVVQKEVDHQLGMSDRQRKVAGVSDKDVENTKARLDVAKSEQSLAQSNYDYYTKAEKDKTDTFNQQEDLRTEKSKFAEDERRKYALETIKLQVDAIKDANERILSDPRSSLQQRVTAVSSNATQDRVEAGGQFNNAKQQFSAGQSTLTEFMTARKEYQAALTKIDKDEADKRRDIAYQYYVRDRDAQVEIFKYEQQDRMNNAQVVLQDEKSTFSQRQKAQAQNYDALRNTAGAEFLKDLDQLGLTNEERLKITDGYNSQLLKLNSDYEQTQQEEQKREKEKQLQQLENFYEKQKDMLKVSQQPSHNDLNDQLTSGRISTEDYDRKKEQENFEARKSDAQVDVTHAEAKYNAAAPGSQEQQSAQAQLATAAMNLSDMVADNDEKNIKKVEDLRKEAAEASEKAIVSAVDDAYAAQIRNIERVLVREGKLKDAQLKRIEDSSLGEQQKAAAEAVINKQAELNANALEKRERELKIRQARFDRDVAVAETIEQGAVAAIAALKIPIYGEAEAIAIGIITAAKVSEILARPLPTYGFGTEDHPGGLAITGDRFESEYIKEPGKAGYWSPNTPTVMDLAPHTQVIPPSEIERMASENMFINNRGMLIYDSKNNPDKIALAINQQTSRLEKAINRQRKTTVVHNKIDTKWADYVKTNVYR